MYEEVPERIEWTVTWTLDDKVHSKTFNGKALMREYYRCVKPNVDKIKVIKTTTHRCYLDGDS